MEGNHPNEVTKVVSRKIKPGYEKEYDDWLRRYLAIERKASGYLGTTIIMQGGTNSPIRYIIHRYTDKSSLQEWENSQQTSQTIRGTEQLFKTALRVRNGHGNTVYFTKLENYSSPPKWKMAIVIFIAANTINSLTHSILNPYLASWLLLASTAFYTGILVALLTYFAMPGLTRLLRRWLYPRKV